MYAVDDAGLRHQQFGTLGVHSLTAYFGTPRPILSLSAYLSFKYLSFFLSRDISIEVYAPNGRSDPTALVSKDLLRENPLRSEETLGSISEGAKDLAGPLEEVLVFISQSFSLWHLYVALGHADVAAAPIMCFAGTKLPLGCPPVVGSLGIDCGYSFTSWWMTPLLISSIDIWNLNSLTGVGFLTVSMYFVFSPHFILSGSVVSERGSSGGNPQLGSSIEFGDGLIGRALRVTKSYRGENSFSGEESFSRRDFFLCRDFYSLETSSPVGTSTPLETPSLLKTLSLWPTGL
ncbi:hypothetical protein ACFE04_004508 [Oxalis oulophora]